MSRAKLVMCAQNAVDLFFSPPFKNHIVLLNG